MISAGGADSVCGGLNFGGASLQGEKLTACALPADGQGGVGDSAHGDLSGLHHAAGAIYGVDQAAQAQLPQGDPAQGNGSNGNAA